MPNSNNDIDFIKSLFVDINKKVENSQIRTEEKIDLVEEKLISEIKDFRNSLSNQQKEIEDRLAACEKKVDKHDGHFTTIKIFFTSGIASLIGVYYWAVSVVDKLRPHQ